MRRAARVPVALVLAAITVAVTVSACDPSAPSASDPIALGTDDPPFRGAWQTVHTGPFIPLLPDGTPAIDDLVIGRTTAFDGNFENRGDVILEFDAEPGTIAIEMRPFAAAPTPAEADAILGRLGLWAFRDAIDAPLAPDAMDPADRCDVAATWPDGCAIYVHFDGDVQPPGSGADLRVHLPADYRRKVAIGTADNVPSEAYPNRGNVCVAGLPGRVDVELGSGIAAITVAADSLMPACPAELVSACENYDEPSLAVVDGVFDGMQGRVDFDLDTKTFWKDFDHAMRRHVAPAVSNATRGAVDAAMAAALSEENGVRVEALAAHATHGVIKGLSQGIREDLGPALAHMIVHDLAPAGAAAMEHEIMPAFARALSQPTMQAAIAGTMSSVARNLVRGGDAGMETAKAEAAAEGKVGALGVFGDRLSMGLGVMVVGALAFAAVLVLLVVLLLRSNRGQQRLVAQGKRREDELLAVVEELDHTTADFDAAKLRELLKQHIRSR